MNAKMKKFVRGAEAVVAATAITAAVQTLPEAAQAVVRPPSAKFKLLRPNLKNPNSDFGTKLLIKDGTSKSFTENITFSDSSNNTIYTFSTGANSSKLVLYWGDSQVGLTEGDKYTISAQIYDGTGAHFITNATPLTFTAPTSKLPTIQPWTFNGQTLTVSSTAVNAADKLSLQIYSLDSSNNPVAVIGSVNGIGSATVSVKITTPLPATFEAVSTDLTVRPKSRSTIEFPLF